MSHTVASLLMSLLFLVTTSGTGQTDQSSKKRFTVVPYQQSQPNCHPAYVKAVSIGAVPPEVLTSSVTVESVWPKRITALKLTWKVYSWTEGLQKRQQSCDAATEATVFLEGTTPLIQVGQLSQNETYNITTRQPAIAGPATKTIFIDQPIIAWDEVKSLTSDGTRETFKDSYAAVIYVSEIHFEDGTTWEGKI